MKKYICILMAALIVLGSVSVVFAAPSLHAEPPAPDAPSSFNFTFYHPSWGVSEVTYYRYEFRNSNIYNQVSDILQFGSYTGPNYIGDWNLVLQKFMQSNDTYSVWRSMNYLMSDMTPQQMIDASKAADRDGAGLSPSVDDGSPVSDMVEYSKYVNSLIMANNATLKGVFSNESLPNLSSVSLQGSSVNLYRSSTGSYTFYEVLNAFLNTLVGQGYGSTFGYNDICFRRSGIGSSDPQYQLGLIRSGNDDLVTGIIDLIPDLLFDSTHFVALTNDSGYFFEWYPDRNTVYIRFDSLDHSGRDFSHVVSGTGNNLSIIGSGQGLETFKYYYQDALADPVTAALQSNIYAQGVALGLYESGALSLLQKIASGSTAGGSVIVPEGLGQQFLYEGDTNTWIDQSDNSQHYGDLFYNPSTQSYVYNTQNYTYEITNNYNYTHINYYMPGTDVPFSQKDFYYQLPDGRNSMELRAEDVYGINTGFDVVLYDFVASDPYMQALYHFDGDTYNDALPVGYEQANNFFFSYGPASGSYAYRPISFDFSPYLGKTVFVLVDDFAGQGIILSDPTTGSDFLTITRNGTYSFVCNRSSYSYRTGAGRDFLGTLKFYIPEDVEVGIVSNPGSLDFSVNPSYTFVKTGIDSFDTALYFDGLAHSFSFNLPYSAFSRNSDFTVSFRWYQEQSASTADHVMSFGSNSLHWNGSKFTQFNGVNISVDIPYGSWNTVTVVRSGSNLLLFINGLLVSTASYSLNIHDVISFNFAADNNVKYFDEFLMTTVPLYTATHVPRLQPYDSNKVLVVPENVSVDTIAVHGSIPINTYRIGGVRQVFPEYGDVYVYLEGNQVKSIQQYNGFGWVEVSGMVFFAGHWYSLETFRIGGMGNAFDGNISNPDPSGGSSGSGGSSSSGNALIDLGIKFLGLLETIANRIGDIAESIVNGVSGGFTTVTGLLERVIGTIADLITDLVGEFVDLIQQLFVGLANFFSSIFEGIGDFSEDVQSVGGLFSGIFGVLPSSFIRVFIFGIILLISVSVFKLL